MTIEQITRPATLAGPAEVMTVAELGVQRAALQRAMERLDVIKTNCGHCKQFALGACSLHGEVPDEFQKTEGQCSDWTYDGVPW